ncbi:YkgB family protein [Flavobacterium agricola]|uniref:YkgB family protein n=1 Tax=Flavobacterium agricola TaxID=2870839 RepID=A0ABY6M3U3_9FLAO|nr:YkgB family protein [Flavobacterium agricola]UYW02550.1 YkgB family protein [Flavobacterium agricola]
MEKLLVAFAKLEANFINFLRISIFVVMAWIGGLKAFQYEADGIVAFVTNSPFMSFFYANSGNMAENDKGELVAEYTLYKNPEGKVVQKNIDWHKQNHTYIFSYGLGVVIIGIGTFVLLGIWFDKAGFIGGVLTFLMAIVTLSFLITTPETWVPNLGGDFPSPQFGFPYLSAAGRLVIKDIIMMAGGLVIAADSAKKILK